MHMCLIPDFLVCFTILAQELANCFLRDQRESILGTGPYTVETTWYIKYVCSNESLFTKNDYWPVGHMLETLFCLILM